MASAGLLTAAVRKLQPSDRSWQCRGYQEDKGGAGQPATQCQIGSGEQEQTRPPDKNEAVALEPVIEDVEPSPLWRAPQRSS